MTERDVDKLLKVYAKANRVVKQMKYKVLEMQRSLIEPNAGLSFSEVKGNTVPRHEKFSELMDIENEYYKELAKNERACLKIKGLIQNIYTKSEEKKEELSIVEDILMYYYVDLHIIVDIILETSYSRRQVFRNLKRGRNIIAKQLEGIDVKEVYEYIYSNETLKKVKDGTQWHSLMC